MLHLTNLQTKGYDELIEIDGEVVYQVFEMCIRDSFIVESNYKGLISDTWEVDISNGAALATCWF